MVVMPRMQILLPFAATVDENLQEGCLAKEFAKASLEGISRHNAPIAASWVAGYSASCRVAIPHRFVRLLIDSMADRRLSGPGHSRTERK